MFMTLSENGSFNWSGCVHQKKEHAENKRRDRQQDKIWLNVLIYYVLNLLFMNFIEFYRRQARIVKSRFNKHDRRVIFRRRSVREYEKYIQYSDFNKSRFN